MECLPSMHQGLASMSNLEGRKGEREGGREGRKERQRGEQREKRKAVNKSPAQSTDNLWIYSYSNHLRAAQQCVQRCAVGFPHIPSLQLHNKSRMYSYYCHPHPTKNLKL